MVRRRDFLAGSAVLAALQWASVARAQVQPIRIGMLSVKSGALAAGGKQMEDGFNLFLKE